MTDDQRWRTAVHEASHAVVDHLNGRRVLYLSVRPGVSHSGVTGSEVTDEERVDLDVLLGGEVFATDSRARGLVERSIVDRLAGEIAERAITPSAGYRPLASPAVTRAAESYVELAPRHRELMAHAEVSQLPTDETKAEAMAVDPGTLKDLHHPGQ